MNIRFGLSILALAGTLACGGGGGSSSSTPPPPAGPPPNTVWIGGAGSYGGPGPTAFDPSTLTVAVGTTVTFSWQGGTHTLTPYSYNGSPTFPGVPGLPGQSSGTYTYQFNTAGTYYYYCENHGQLTPGGTSLATGMAGKVIVQ